MNCDGAVNALDQNPFVKAITNPTQYHQLYPDCDIMRADLNGDGSVNSLDISLFSGVLTAGGVAEAYEWDAENRLVFRGPGRTPQSGDTATAYAYIAWAGGSRSGP